MANPMRGEGEVRIGERSFRLVIDINALIEAEDAARMDMQALLGEFEQGRSLKPLRALFWAALRKHHADVHLVEAGELLSEAGLKAVAEPISKLLVAVFPAPSGDAKPRPRKAASGTG
jgi:hypothetical protein